MSKFWISGHRQKKAFLLVEVLLTIAILATGLTFLVRSLLTSLRAEKLVSDYFQAQILLENNLALRESQIVIEDGLQIEENLPAPDDKFKFKLTTQNIKVNNETGALNNVEAGVSWVSQKRSSGVSISTYLLNEANEEE